MNRASVIPVGVTLVGDIEGDADLVVLGRVDGPIDIGGALVIEESGQVRGHVRARSVTVRGVLKGNAYGDEAVRVDSKARLVGELTAPRVSVAVGAQFAGQVHVGEIGEPHLSIYDPALHTFTGTPISNLDAPIVRMTVPVPPPDFSVSPTEESVTEAAEIVAEVSVPEAAEPVAAVAAEPVAAEVEPVSKREPAPLKLRMPVLGRVRGHRRGPS